MDKPTDLDNYPLEYELPPLCAACGEPILSRQHRFTGGPSGEMFHSRDEADEYSQMLGFYETLDMDYQDEDL